ncbi:Positive regulator of CheA protein activity(CheW) [Pseudomonas avellanae BPIC 631]|nr:Positive regulator of CheA protein activity(CheW) [Pseudomonas avellanae BPIC 631]
MTSATPLVAILKYGGGYLGLAIDAVCDILKARDSQFSPLGPGGTSVGLLPALLLSADESRMIYKLDLGVLSRLPGVLFAADPSAQTLKEEALAAKNRLLHYLVFECDGRNFCIDASVVTELVDGPEITASDFASDCCFGVTSVRGTKVPALNLSEVLGLDHQRQTSKPQLLLLTAPDGRVCGFGYDRMVAIQRQDPDSLLAAPGYGLPHPELLAGVMNLEEGQQALLLDHPMLLQRPEVKSYTQVYQHDVKPAQASHDVTKAMLRHACLPAVRRADPLCRAVEPDCGDHERAATADRPVATGDPSAGAVQSAWRASAADLPEQPAGRRQTASGRRVAGADRARRAVLLRLCGQPGRGDRRLQSV